MRIGIDCRTILNPNGGELAGVGHYTYYLVKNLLAIDKDNEYVLFFARKSDFFKEFEAANVTIKIFPFYGRKKYLPIIYSHLLVSLFFAKEKLDLLHCPANVIPLFYRWPSVVTVHDLAIYKYPEMFPSGKVFKQSFATKVSVPNSLKRAKKIIAVSESTKNDIMRLFGVANDKIGVVYEGVESWDKDHSSRESLFFLKEKYGIGDKYLLFIGSIEPRKNLARLVRAFKGLALENDSPAAGCQLILAGGKGWKNEDVFKEIELANSALSEKRSGEAVKYLGYVSNEDKMSLIGRAAGFVFPSLYEGFGLPVLEAMSAAVPVVTSNVSSLPEIAGRDGALLINPEEEKEIKEAMARILSDKDLSDRLSIGGGDRARMFSWEKCARQTLEIYEKITK